jgi:AraC-like DNA-binding protein
MANAVIRAATSRQSSALRRKWLFNTVRQFQIAAGQLADAEAISRTLADVRRPHNAIEDVILRGLMAELELRRRAAAPLLRWRPGVEPNLAERTKKLIDAKFDTLTTVELIAREIGCHPVHLERLFRRTYGTTVHRYLRVVRVDASISLLSNSSIKIEAIQHLVGFKGKGTFYRAIQERTGHTPSYVRQHSLPGIAMR